MMVGLVVAASAVGRRVAVRHVRLAAHLGAATAAGAGGQDGRTGGAMTVLAAAWARCCGGSRPRPPRPAAPPPDDEPWSARCLDVRPGARSGGPGHLIGAALGGLHPAHGRGGRRRRRLPRRGRAGRGIVSTWWRNHGLAAQLLAFVQGKIPLRRPGAAGLAGRRKVEHFLHAGWAAVIVIGVVAGALAVVASIALGRRDVA